MPRNPQVLDYVDVRAIVQQSLESVLVVGNGLSIAFAGQRLDWQALRDVVVANGMSPVAARAFEVIGSADFEGAARLLHETSEMLKTDHFEIAPQYAAESSKLCQDLASAVLEAHPQGWDRPSKSQAAACGQFLSDYSRVVTLNYDLLLYWAALESGATCVQDGFGNCNTYDAEALCWNGSDGPRCIEYMHGALHLFSEGMETKKLRGTGRGLVQQVADRIRRNSFPLVVAAPTSTAKERIIGRSPYLSSVYRRLKEPADVIVTFGWSASAQDQHVVNAIANSRCSTVCVGCHGLDGGITGSLAEFTRKLIAARKQVVHFDTTSLNVWGSKTSW